jgi:hypothetical protein
MNALLALILLGQAAGDTSISDSFTDRFSQAQPPATLEPNVDEVTPAAALEAPAAARPPSRVISAADSPATRPRTTQAVANGATQRATIQPNIPPTAPAVSELTQYATEILEGVLARDEQTQPRVRKIKLVEVISQSMDVQGQAIAIGAYWEVAMHGGRLGFAQHKVAFLSTIPAPNDAAERAVLESALATAEANEATAQDELLAAQYRLIRSAAISWNEVLPWPADVPFVGAYRTNYETFFAQRTAPLEIRHIHQSLPGKLRLIERCAASVSAAETATETLAQSYKQGRSSVTTLLESIERLERARHAFLSAVVDYNDRIAEYSLAAVGTSIGPETLVSTLIKAPSAAANMTSIPRDMRAANVETSPAAPVGAFRR